jgi:hypothetical protein
MPTLKYEIDVANQSSDAGTVSNSARYMRNCFFDTSGNIVKTFGTEEFFDFSSVNAKYATKDIDGIFWFQEIQKLVVVIDTDIFLFSSQFGTYTKIGSSLLMAGARISFVKVTDADNLNTVTLFMANGNKVVYYDQTTCDYVENNANYIGTIPDTVTHLAVLDGFLFANDTGNQTLVYYSASNKPFDWSNSYDTSAEAFTDNISSIYTSGGKLWITGKESIEAMQNTGQAVAIRRVPGGLVETGLVNNYSIGIANKTVFCMNTNREIVVIAGYEPVNISNIYANRIQTLSSTLDVKADVQAGVGGKIFIIFNFRDSDTSIVYDYSHKLATGKDAFYEWNEWDEDSQSYKQYPYQGYEYAVSWNYHFVGGRNNGKLYLLKTDKYTFDSTPIRTEIITGLYGDDIVETKIADLVPSFRRGDGLDSDGFSTAYAYLQTRKNRTKNWGNRITMDLGNSGDTRSLYKKIGIGAYHTIQYRILHTDDSPFVLYGLYGNVKG